MRFDMMKRMISMMLAMILLFSCVPVNAFATETESTQGTEPTSSVTTGFEGKTVSILGDSISTYTGVSDNTSYNSTIGSNAVYYTAGRYDIYRADTWWQQVIDALGMELLVNNSWSGSMVVYPRRGEGSEGYKTRCVNLHNNADEEPDVILVFMGTNDFSYVNTEEFLGLYTLGTADAVDYETLIVDNGDGTYTYATPATTCEAYAIMLHKMKNRYPNAEIYCMNLMQRRDPDYADSYADAGQPTEFNAELVKIIAKYECTLVDLENCGIEADSSVFDLYIGDKRVHPNSLGMDLMSEAVISAMLGQDTDIYDVSFDLTNVTGDGAHAVLPGNPYTVTLAEAEGFKNMSVTVTMGGEDVTANCYADGVVSIPSVIGDVVITAETTERDPLNFRWEFDGTALSTITSDGNTENALTKLAGSVTNGVFSNTRYQMDRTVMLLHDRPWILEWKGTGKGGVMLAADSVATTGDPFFFRRQASQMFAFGIYEGSQYNNYGITLPESIDTTLEHTYRLENRIADDGSNMVYLYVDDAEIGALNQYFVAGTAQGTTSDWICRQDFLFNYIGTESHPLTDMSVTYLQIEEDSSVHHHGYTAVVTPPTYTEGGYTTYTCAGCGDSYVADYTDAIALYSYRWEMVDNGLESVTSDGNTANPLTLNAGSVTDGTFSGARYTLKNSVRLYHDAPWGLEWKASGDWSAMLLTSTAQSATEDMTFIFRTYNETGLLALGTYSGGSYHNYGIALADYDLDMTQEHTYRLENRIAEDGSNMVYLTVDGTELGAMNNYYIGGTNNQNQTVDWVNGRDFTFGFMGSTSHPLKDMALSYLQVWEGGEPELLPGKTISILGASMSTYTGISNNADTNSTIGNNAVYYTEGRHGVYANDTWWMQVANDLDLRLLVNNSWSGSSLLYTRNGTVGAYVDRCVQLHDDTGDNAGEEPDIIGIQMGTNDYQYYKDTLGTADIGYDTLIVDNGDGTYTYAEPTTSLEAAAIVMHKISIRYPDAEVYYLNLSQRVDITDETAGILETFNENLATVCAHFGVTIVDIYNSGITQENFDTYIGDGRVHPNCFGMDAYTEAFKKALLGNHEELAAYTVDFQLNNVTADYGVNKQVLSGKSFTCTLTAPEYFKPQVTVTMGGEDITDSCYADGVVTIEAVTADVVLTAEAVLDHEPANYRWEFDGIDLATVTTDGNVENVLTKLAGSSTDGVFSTTSYSLEKTIVLSHDQPWSVEWKSEGTWKGTSTSGGRLFSTASTSSNNTRYIFKSVNSYLIAIGERTSSGSYNYGIALTDHGIDGSERHIYRLENRIAEDGSNMVWLYVDGVEIGALNNLYMGTTDQNTTSDWLSGQDFLFPYIGTETHGLNNCSVDYVQVWEGGADHYHTYTTEVTEPTYTAGGYTTYTCECGHSFVDDYTDPIVLHTYRWELVEDAFVPVTTDGAEENPLSLQNGSITDGAFTNVLYNIDTSIHLYHDQPWVIEWKSSGDNARTAGGTAGGSGLLSSNTVLKSDEGTWFLYKRPSTYLIALCYRDASTSIQSGIALADHGINGSELHIYRLENRVAKDGSNMVYLIVDGTEIGAMNNLFVSAVDQGETTDFLNGLDWTFDYMGITSYYLNNCSIEYMQIWEGGEPADYEGKTISILGDSISTYTGVSDDASVNATLSGGAIYYTPGRWDIYQEDTWWQQTIDALGMELLVNNSWSGSCVLHTRRGTVGAYVDRCVQLHNDKTGEEPDVIVTFIAANDFSYYQDTLGTAAIAYDTLIVENADGSFTYAEPATTCEAYAIMLHKMTVRYPDAQIYCMTPTARRDPDKEDDYADVGQPTAFNAELMQITEYFGCKVVDLETCGIDKEAEVFDQYIADGRTHPNAEGMDLITQALIRVMLGTDAVLLDVSAEYVGVRSDNGAAAALSGRSYVANLTVQNGYTNMNVTVTMGGEDVTDTVYSDGMIRVEKVTGDIVISAAAEREPQSFRWEFDGSELVSTGEMENALSALAGAFTDGVLNDGRYDITIPVLLKHDLPWELEWQFAEDWRGVVLSSDPAQNTTGMYYLSRTKGGQLCLGTWTGSQYSNYGIDLSYLDSQTHTYRLVNRIAEDGSNMVWLYVDKQEIGPMNNYYIGSKDQSTTSDWVSGKDFVFAHMGIEGHPVTNCAVGYIQVWEGGRPADYTGKVISIMGDSISTFDGYIPVADGFNREHLARYPQDDLLTDVNETWWMQVVAELDAKLGINESWRGSTLSGAVPVTTGDTGENAAMSNLIRIQNMGSNGTPDVILLYGGTNDLAHVSEVGTFDPATAPTEVDLTTKKWDNLADGFVHTLLRMRYYYPDAVILAMLPTYTASYYTDEKLAEGNAVMAQICEHYGIPYVDLRDSGVTADHLPDGIHPGEEGMDLITAAVVEALLEKAELEPGEHVVYPVSHELTQVKASLGHWKGVDANSTFTEVLTGEEMTVTVTMDGVDITADCYEDGTITIETVTGALVITATGKFTLDGHLQQLPDPYCSVNLWQALEHDEMYYASGGWTTHASGQVKSVTFPVTPGDRLYASSFGAAGTNGGTINGIRVTYFAEDGTADSIDADKIYEEFSIYGYLTVPDDAVAVSIPMWTDSEDWEIYLYCVLHGHLQQLPEGAYNDTNLWPLLEHDAEYYSADGWTTHSSGNVKSVTIPVSPGDKLYASSFGAAGTNGSSTNGIRVTYFAEHSVLVSVGAATVYQEFSENGYLTVPEGVYAVSIPMWTDSEDWELYILTLPDRPVVTVEISWGAMEFTYTDGQWNPDTHTYAEGTWTADENSNYITVANEGTLDATVTFVYENAEGYAFAGTFVDGETAVITDSLILPADATQTVWLTLVGRPEEYLDCVTVGTVTVIIE